MLICVLSFHYKNISRDKVKPITIDAFKIFVFYGKAMFST